MGALGGWVLRGGGKGGGEKSGWHCHRVFLTRVLVLVREALVSVVGTTASV